VHVTVIGGRLQGLEAAYLAKKAGYHVTVIDKCSDVPAHNICDRFCHMDANEKMELRSNLAGTDLIIPTIENEQVLNSLAEVADDLKLPLAFDFKAYQISASKSVSDRLFAEIKVPSPVPWPACGFPIIVKPVGSSGSEGVRLIRNAAELKSSNEQIDKEEEQWVIQEFLAGPSYSLEIIGHQGCYLPLQVTELEMDDLYNCKRVIAPANLSITHQEQFAQIAVQIAQRINLIGIMDVEIILHDNQLKVLEIDARLPSQTPTVVYKSTGVNMLVLLTESYLHGHLPESVLIEKPQAVIFEHVVVTPGRIAVSGEHAVSSAGALSYRENFFGADEALTNYCPGSKNWMATLIITGRNHGEVYRKRNEVIGQIKTTMNINSYHDPLPCRIF